MIGAQSVTFLICFSHILAVFYSLTLLFSLVSIFESLFVDILLDLTKMEDFKKLSYFDFPTWIRSLDFPSWIRKRFSFEIFPIIIFRNFPNLNSFLT